MYVDVISESDEVYQRLVSMGMPVDNADAVRDAFLAKPEFLNAALDAFDERPLDIPDTSHFISSVLSS